MNTLQFLSVPRGNNLEDCGQMNFGIVPWLLFVGIYCKVKSKFHPVHAMKAHKDTGEVDIQLHSILTLALHGGHLIPGTHWTGGWVDNLKKRKHFLHSDSMLLQLLGHAFIQTFFLVLVRGTHRWSLCMHFR